MTDLASWLDLLGNLGSMGLLLAALWLGLTGKVVPAKLLETIIRRVVEQVLDELEERGKL